MKKSIYFILVACCWAGYLQAQSVQPGDCTGAINLYGNFNYPVMAYPANTVPNENNPATSCLSNGEENGIWFEFLVLDTGVLSFNLIPSNPTDDYDWALFNITGLACSNIYTDTLEVRCNFNNSVTNGGITGANGGSNNQDEPTLNVFPGEWFKLFLSNYGMTSGGFYLDFSASTFGFDGTIGIDESSEPMLANVGPNPSDGFFNLNLNS